MNRRFWAILAVFLSFSALVVWTQYVSAYRGDLMTLDVYLDSQGENVNAFQGTLHFPKTWSIERVDLRDSKTIYWIENPRATLESNSMSFSGIIPGGVGHLDGADTTQLLYSIDFYGYAPESADVSFSDTLFYLNHPATLKAEKAYFNSTLRPSDTQDIFTEDGDLLGLQFSFTTDPVTHENVLLLNSTEGKFASYTFREKEGDLNFSNWLPVDGLQILESNASTVLLSSVDDAGGTHELLLRSSFLHQFFWWMITFFFVLFTVYLLVAAYRIFRLK